MYRNDIFKYPCSMKFLISDEDFEYKVKKWSSLMNNFKQWILGNLPMVIVQISEGDMEGKSFPLSCKNVTTLLKKHISYSQQNLNDLSSTMILLATSDDIINLCITSFKLTQCGYLVYPENRGTQRGVQGGTGPPYSSAMIVTRIAQPVFRI